MIFSSKTMSMKRVSRMILNSILLVEQVSGVRADKRFLETAVERCRGQSLVVPLLKVRDGTCVRREHDPLGENFFEDT